MGRIAQIACEILLGLTQRCQRAGPDALPE